MLRRVSWALAQISCKLRSSPRGHRHTGPVLRYSSRMAMLSVCCVQAVDMSAVCAYRRTAMTWLVCATWMHSASMTTINAATLASATAASREMVDNVLALVIWAVHCSEQSTSESLPYSIGTLRSIPCPQKNCAQFIVLSELCQTSTKCEVLSFFTSSTVSDSDVPHCYITLSCRLQ